MSKTRHQLFCTAICEMCSLRVWQNQEKEKTDYWIECFPLEIFFSTDSNVKCSKNCSKLCDVNPPDNSIRKHKYRKSELSRCSSLHVLSWTIGSERRMVGEMCCKLEFPPQLLRQYVGAICYGRVWVKCSVFGIVFRASSWLAGFHNFFDSRQQGSRIWNGVRLWSGVAFSNV